MKIFYSWQSDLDTNTNQNAIRHAIRQAINEVESNKTHGRVELDEATRNKSGSPNIPLTIFQKIEESDIFIVDVTTINSDSKNSFKKTPNPNVLIELGFAIAHLGWERIILLFNKKYGDFPNDLPFDIDRHRATPFLIESKTDKSGKNALAKTLEIAIGAIYDFNPKRPKELVLDADAKKRKNDLNKVSEVIKRINLSVYDSFIYEFPDRIYKKIFEMKDSLYEFVFSSNYFIYNTKINDLILDVTKLLNTCLSSPSDYYSDGSEQFYKFHLVMDTFTNDKSEENYKKLEIVREKLIDAMKNLIELIRTEYIEIDFDEIVGSHYEK